ncbi:hypothetical protein WICPIJ_005193 [Wickerhamomyces pijperi]|uniref:MIF4G domain-containing protein n=1 Tax=Wickerhamomyces pijperi TaxID=599730 RepID=A0A9P8Q6P3_WICPI|nr:hypothetical protein WICPIJ_005193 [Wickerhamomyces pijperi]
MSSGKSFTPNNGNNQQRPAGNGGYNAYNANTYNPNNSYYYSQPVYGYSQPAYGAPYMSNGVMYPGELQGRQAGAVQAPIPASKPAVATKPAEDDEAAKKREEFRMQLLEKARAKKEALEAKKKAAQAQEPVVAEEIKKEEPVKVEEPVKAEEAKVEEPVKVEEAPKSVEPEAEAPKPEEAEPVKAAEAEEPKEAEPAAVSTEEPAVAAAPVVTEAPKQANEPKPLDSKYAHILEQNIEEPEFSNNVPNYADLVPKFAELKLVENANEYNYEDPLKRPDEKLLARGPVLRYDPMFLNQFSHFKFDAGEEFQKRLLFVVKSIHEKPAPKNNSGRGGFGQGSIGGYNKSSQNLRRLDSRSNSRQGSKRKPQNNNNRSERKSNRRGPSDRHHNDDREKEPEVPAEPVKPLEKSANRWVPKSRQAKTEEVKYAPDGVTVILPLEDIKRKVKSQLNKLTLEYFDPITDEIIKMAEQSKWEEDAQTLKSVIDSIFDKAVDEPHWSAMYAQFCAKIFKSISPEVKDTTSLAADGTPLSGGALFRKYLLTKCQVEYEKGWVDKLPTNEDGTPIEPELMSDEYYQIATAKRRGLGLVKFFGQLYVLSLLGENIIFFCLQSQSKNIDDPSDDTVENLIQLVKTVGPKLDHSSPSARANFDNILNRIAALSKNDKIPSRLQFHLMDVLDSRKSGWSGSEEAGPKTISQIHAEESKKQQMEQREKLEKRRQKGNDSRQNSGRGQWTNNRVSDSDFQRAGQVSTPSHSSGPTNNFQRGKSSRNNNNNNSRLGNNSNNFNNSNKTSASSPLANVSGGAAAAVAAAAASAANAQGLGSRENSKRPLNAFSALDQESEESEEEDEDEEEEDDSAINEDSAKVQDSAETAETSTSEEATAVAKE